MKIFLLINPGSTKNFVKIKIRGQALIEVTFSMIVIVVLLLAMIRVFFWVSEDLSNRRAAHEQTLVSPVTTDDKVENYRQIRPLFYEGTPIDAAAFNSEIFGPNRFGN